MNMINSKKGASHIEMVISFAIFVGFVVFLFSILNPFQKPENPGIVDNVYYGLEDEFKTTISAISIKVLVTTPTENCFKITGITGFCEGSGEKIIIRNKDGVIVSAKKSVSGEFEFSKEIGESKFITIYCSEEITEQPHSCTTYKTLAAGDYDSGIITDINAWSKAKIAGSPAYDELKSSILAVNKDFKATFKYIIGSEWQSISAPLNAPKGVEIYANSYPIEVLESNSSISKNMITIQVW